VGVLKALFVSRVSLGLAMFALGGAAGATLAAAALHVWPPQAPPTRIAPSAPSVPVAAQTLGEPAVPTPPAPPVQTEPAEPAAAMTPTATAPQAPAPAPRTQAAKRPDPNRGLAEEAGLLQAARVALAPDPGGALSLIDQHAERFPGGQLVQEREALRVQALVSAGRFDEARAAGARLEQRFPESLSLPSVRKALASIPDRASPKE
jgi:TolA-binding protein